MADTLASLKDVREFFGMDVPTFRKEWTQQGLTDADKNAIRAGIGNGTLNY